jgi:uncharacterized cupredoxin-like copper-binding protein
MPEASKVKKKRIAVIAGVVILVAVVGMAYFLMQPRAVTFKIEMWDFGFNGAKGGPTLRVKAGQMCRIELINKGGVEHEFMIVTKEWIDRALKDPHDHEIHELAEPVFPGADVELEVGESAVITFVADKPGRYYYACFEMEPEDTNHVWRGMYAEFIVEP